MKQTWSFNRWRRRYFQLKGHKLYYAKDPKAAIFDDIDLTDLSFAEASSKNTNHCFQVITPFRRLVLCAESRREMEDWIAALKAAAASRDVGAAARGVTVAGTGVAAAAGDAQGPLPGDLLSGRHRWHAASHARPTYCNVCREALSGVMSHGLSCEVCKYKVHKRCAARAQSSCKWTTLASVGKDILEDVDGNLSMPHQWLEGNLPVSAKCAACERTCGSVLRLQDWRCLWCHAPVHAVCRPGFPVRCPLGAARVSVVPPIALHHIGSDEAWEAARPQGCSPLLVFVNSKSGDNQGVKFLRRFKQLLNPAQVFDLVSGGPGLGLRLFRHFDPFRILVCSGDGSVGWVLSEIDRLNMHRQCQLGVLPLGTGNDLARVLGWGAACDDDTHLPQLLERYEKAGVVMLDRWSVMTFERQRPTVSAPGPSSSSGHVPSTSAHRPAFIAAYEDSVVHHLTQILQSDQHSTVISSAKVLCETVKDFTVRAAEVSLGQGDDEFGKRCQQLKDKLDLLLATLGDEESQEEQDNEVEVPALLQGEEKGIAEKSEKEQQRRLPWNQREALVSRANSLKKAVRRLVEHTEQAVDEQNAQPPRRHRQIQKDTLKVLAPIQSGSSSSCEPSPCPSPRLSGVRLSAISPLPEVRRDSTPCPEDLLLLPAPPDEFADRRKSGVDITVTTPSDDEEEPSSKKDAKDSGNTLLQDSLSSPDDLPTPQRSASDTLLSVEVHVEDIDVARRLSLECLEDIGHIDSPESTEPTSDDRTSPVTAVAAAPGAGLPILFSPDEFEAYQEDPPSFGEEEEGYCETAHELVKGCSLAHFEEGNDIARRSFYRQIRGPRHSVSSRRDTVPSISTEETKVSQNTNFLDVVQIHIQGSSNNLQESHRPSLALSEGEEEVERELLRLHRRSSPPQINVDPPSPTHSKQSSGGGGTNSGLLSATPLIFRRFSDSDTTDKLLADKNLLRCSPAATRRISSGSLLKAPTETPAAPSKRLPLINPLVRLPMWPNVQSGIVSKVLLANADALCAAVSPLMDPDESLLQGYLERCVMNNYFGIGIDAKITLDFHQKREEHPEKCRSRAKNYMWYGVLGSREWLQKTYKNLEQRVQLECDGQRIPLPSLQGIVVLNIPSFMGGTNFWGGSKEDDVFLAPSFDDRILEVVAVFGSMQMAASRLINLQHHRIAQCQTVQISILGDEGLPVQVDGEAWVQPPGVIRIIHKNRMQMLCRNRALESSLKTWEEKRRHRQQLSPSPSQQASTSASTADPEPETDPVLWSPQENLLLLGFIESATTVVKYVKLTAISQPLVGPELYQLAAHTAGLLERLHPGGKIVEGPNLRPQVTELVQSCRQLYEEACALLRDKHPNLKLHEDLEHKLGGALASLETELRRCVTYDSAGLVHFQPSPQIDEHERKGRGRKLFRLRFRRGGSGGARGSRELVQGWGTAEVAEWLEALQLGEYAEAFTRHDVHGKELLALGRRDLRDLGVTKVGHVKRILAAVRELAA